MSGPTLAHRDDSFGLRTTVQPGAILAGRVDTTARTRGRDELAPVRGFMLACVMGACAWVAILGAIFAALRLI